MEWLQKRYSEFISTELCGFKDFKSHLHLFTDCFMKISPQLSEQIQLLCGFSSERNTETIQFIILNKGKQMHQMSRCFWSCYGNGRLDAKYKTLWVQFLPLK